MTEILCPMCQSVALNVQDGKSLLPPGSWYYCVLCKFSFEVDGFADLTLNGKEDEYWTRLDEERNEVIFEGRDSEGGMYSK